MEEAKSSTTLRYYTRRSKSKRQKHDEEAEKDIISGLPDELICYILSFLPTKYAVGTSILSKRWKFLWTSVPVLDFDDTLLLDPEKKRWEVRDSPEYMRMFGDFVDRVLELNTMQSIKKFNLYCGGRNRSSHVNAWISAAIMRNVQELYLSISINEGSVELPLSLYCCEKLVILKLSHEINFNVPESMHFPSLKVLHLTDLEHLDDSNIAKLLSGSPVLEELEIERIYSSNMQILNVRSNSLKRLKIYSCNPVPDYYLDPDPFHNPLADQNDHYKVVIDVPNLEFFDFEDFFSQELTMKHASSLVEAIIGVGPFSDIDFDGYADMVVQLLRQISCVKVLCLSSTMHMLTKAYERHSLALENFPTFHNVTHLTLLAGGSETEIIPDILKHTPNLQVLVLLYIKAMWDPSKSVPQCLLSSLKVVQFNSFDGCDEEFKAAEYILKNAKVLEKMHIHAFCINDRSDMLKKLLAFPRASTSCQIALEEA